MILYRITTEFINDDRFMHCLIKEPIIYILFSTIKIHGHRLEHIPIKWIQNTMKQSPARLDYK